MKANLAIPMLDPTFLNLASWASVLGFVVAAITLYQVGRIKKSVIRFRRKQRIKQIVDEVLSIPDDAIPLGPASLGKMAVLKRNVPTNFWDKFSERGRAALLVHTYIDDRDIVALKEAIKDWNSFSEDL